MKVALDSASRTPVAGAAAKDGWVVKATLIGVVLLCTLAFIATLDSVVIGLTGKDAPGTRDFVEYWAAGQQLVHGQNPYDRVAILRLERAQGFPVDTPVLVIPNPPIILPLLFPLGYLGSRTAESLWIVLLLVCLVASVRMVWSMLNTRSSDLQILGYTFAPAIFCLAAGQISLLVLLGLALFLRFHRSRSMLAGASLWFCALKPHLFVAFGVVLILWVIARRRFSILVGAASALIGSLIAAFVLDGSAWSQYREMMIAARVDRVTIPCWSILLRQTISPSATWLQYLPMVAACIWAVWYFRKHNEHWDWVEHGSLLVLVSVLAAPYTWLIDQCVAIPALLYGLSVTRSRVLVATLALASATMELAPLRHLSILHSNFYLWTAPAWLGWYIAVRWLSGQRDSQQLSKCLMADI